MLFSIQQYLFVNFDHQNKTHWIFSSALMSFSKTASFLRSLSSLFVFKNHVFIHSRLKWEHISQCVCTVSWSIKRIKGNYTCAKLYKSEEKSPFWPFSPNFSFPVHVRCLCFCFELRKLNCSPRFIKKHPKYQLMSPPGGGAGPTEPW